MVHHQYQIHHRSNFVLLPMRPTTPSTLLHNYRLISSNTGSWAVTSVDCAVAVSSLLAGSKNTLLWNIPEQKYHSRSRPKCGVVAQFTGNVFSVPNPPVPRRCNNDDSFVTSFNYDQKNFLDVSCFSNFIFY